MSDKNPFVIIRTFILDVIDLFDVTILLGILYFALREYYPLLMELQGSEYFWWYIATLPLTTKILPLLIAYIPYSGFARVSDKYNQFEGEKYIVRKVIFYINFIAILNLVFFFLLEPIIGDYDVHWIKKVLFYVPFFLRPKYIKDMADRMG